MAFDLIKVSSVIIARKIIKMCLAGFYFFDSCPLKNIKIMKKGIDNR